MEVLTIEPRGGDWVVRRQRHGRALRVLQTLQEAVRFAQLRMQDGNSTISLTVTTRSKAVQAGPNNWQRVAPVLSAEEAAMVASRMNG